MQQRPTKQVRHQQHQHPSTVCSTLAVRTLTLTCSLSQAPTSFHLAPIISLSLALAHTATETAAFIFKSNESEIAGAPLSAHYTPLSNTFAGGLRKWSKHEIDIINTQLETLQMSFDETETAREAPRATTTGFCVALLILLLLLLL